MSVFGGYSRYYDLLYRDKAYAAEAAYVARTLKRERPNALTVLDLGAGTGRHDFELCELGFEVTGVDLSAEMLERAQAERALREASGRAFPAPLPTFAQGDVRDVRLGKKYDAVVSLFHVMSYQTSNADLRAALVTIREHLRPGGVFLFDAWYGPTVLSDRPVVRVRRLQGETAKVTRLAEPVLHPNENVVDVNYQIFVEDLGTGQVEQLRETHRMRYLFVPEVRELLVSVGLSLDRACEFMTDAALGFASWNALFVGTRPE